MTSAGRAAPFRPPITFAGKRGFILLDQIRTLDKTRLVKRLGKAPSTTVAVVLRALRDVFAE